jgi:hypothetical protein
MIKEYVFNEILGGFNPDVIIANKPSALYRGLNLDLEKEPGSIRKRKGSAIFGSQITSGKDVLGLYDFIKSNGTRVPLAVLNNAGDTQSVVHYYSAGWNASGLTDLTASKNPSFETFLNYCFATNGEEIKTSADGNTWSTVNLLNTVAISAVSYSDPTVTLTVPAGHQVVVGDLITVTGLAPAGYNVTDEAVTAVTDTTIAFSETGLGAVTDQVGSLTVQFALAANDVIEYVDQLYLIGLSGFRSDIMWSNVPIKGTTTYTIDWNRQNNVSIMLGDGEELIAGHEYRGALYLFKNNGVARTVAPVATNGIKILTDNIGANSKKCIQNVGGQLIFFCDGNKNAKKGFYSYNSLADAEPQLISEPMQPYIDGMTAGTEVVAGVINNLYVAYIGDVSNDEEDLDVDDCILVFNAITNRWLGAWSYGTEITSTAQLTQSNVASLYFGNNAGTVYQTNTGGEDLVSGTGNAIPWEAISHSIDLAKSYKGPRRNFRKRKVNNVWVVGDNQNHTQFNYRFNAVLASKDGWMTKSNLNMPVSELSLIKKDAYLWQFSLFGTGTVINEPIIRKVTIDYE